ncbi:sigma-70 family RNA polymerase sigma factor [Scytonema sp. NUACC21]
MNELNLYLQSLIQEACRHSPASPQHRKALNSLLRAVQKSGRIWRPAAGDLYEETLYEEALCKTMFNLTKKICDKYDPSRGSFMTWFNTCLRHQYTDEIRTAQRDRSHRQSVWQNDQNDEVRLDPLDRVTSGIDANLLLDTWESFVQWIKDDPDDLLKACHIENNPKANCQLLAHLRLVIGKEWQEIVVEVGSSRGAVTSHWCRKCESRLREWLDTNQRLFGEDNYER